MACCLLNMQKGRNNNKYSRCQHHQAAAIPGRGERQLPAAQDFPALCQPYASLHTASSQIAARPRQSEEGQFRMHEVCTL
jgi:hypothetical protein